MTATDSVTTTAGNDLARDIEALGARLAAVRLRIGRVIFGQAEVIDQALITLLAGGHALLIGVPGLAKTRLVETLGTVLDLDDKRVQCTPDLMPADILGGNIFHLPTSTFVLHRGPVFTDLLLVDEINRMPPRTQAALLESMEERQVTIDGKHEKLSNWFTVFATQNPVEFEGTYPLPEAQLDRFLMKIRVDYPNAEDEVEILARSHAGFDARHLDRIEWSTLSPETLAEARTEVRQVRVEPELLRYVAELARSSRAWPALSLGASPRAGLSLLLAGKAYAAIQGRDYLIPDDVKQVAPPVLRHRFVLRPEAELEGLSTDRVVQDVCSAVEVPR